MARKTTTKRSRTPARKGLRSAKRPSTKKSQAPSKKKPRISRNTVRGFGQHIKERYGDEN